MGSLAKLRNIPFALKSLVSCLCSSLTSNTWIAVEFKWTNIGTKTDLQSNRGKCCIKEREGMCKVEWRKWMGVGGYIYKEWKVII